MSNLKRRPEKDLNHDNWNDEDPPEEKGEFKRANEEDMKNRKIIKPRRKLAATGEGGSGAPSNPFSGLSFNTGAGAAGASTSSVGNAFANIPAFSFGQPQGSTSTMAAIGGSPCDTATPGGTGSLFKIAGITPSSEPPTKASADSSTADTEAKVQVTQAPTSAGNDEAEIGTLSESDGITEESSNSSSLPWNAAARQREENFVDSNNPSGSAELNNPSWLDDDLDDKEASVASSEVQNPQADVPDSRPVDPAPSSAAADSSQPSSVNNSNNHQSGGHFNFGGTAFSSAAGPSSGGGGSLFQPFQNNNPSSSTNHNNQNRLSSVTSPESSGQVIRNSLDDSADYENDTTSSSNKLPSEDNNCDGEDREAEAGLNPGEGDINDEREAEGIDS